MDLIDLVQRHVEVGALGVDMDTVIVGERSGWVPAARRSSAPCAVESAKESCVLLGFHLWLLCAAVPPLSLSHQGGPGTPTFPWRSVSGDGELLSASGGPLGGHGGFAGDAPPCSEQLRTRRLWAVRGNPTTIATVQLTPSSVHAHSLTASWGGCTMSGRRRSIPGIWIRMLCRRTFCWGARRCSCSCRQRHRPGCIT